MFNMFLLFYKNELIVLDVFHVVLHNIIIDKYLYSLQCLKLHNLSTVYICDNHMHLF